MSDESFNFPKRDYGEEVYDSGFPEMDAAEFEIDVDLNQPKFQPMLQIAGPAGAEYVFTDENPHAGRSMSFSDRGIWLCGTSWATGATIGGAVGFAQGILRTRGLPMRVMINSILNGAGKRGRRYGNALAITALLFSISDLGIYYLRDSSDNYNTVIATSLAPMLYLSGQGFIRLAMGGIAGGIFGGLLLLGKVQGLWNLERIFPTEDDQH
eukprot:TRINITY_DN14816_c0_g1_i1.p1 TRINITY_DN14816_c0_g1~~TRINITY_DN14816_c0_g1_i1.p1  ORF type:complete len:220 (+),score=34.64 TRINITY_DN14816_c0_g1_i1:29-661(+)